MSPPALHTLSLHDALPISGGGYGGIRWSDRDSLDGTLQPRVITGSYVPLTGDYDGDGADDITWYRSEEHTSELQSLRHLVCRLLLEKKKEAPQHTSAHNSH